jgi:putative ABC transport system ATP-binding protein
MTKPADLLRLVDVSKTYVMGEVKVPVLHDVNMAVPRGDVLVIVGPSGSGKSTLLNLIGGLDTPTSGSVFFNDRDIAKSSERELTAYRRENVGFVFQFYNLVPTLTAEENVTVTTELCRDPVKPAEALRLVGLEQRADHFPAQLSGGEQQRTAIARAVAKRPQLLLCDEPTGALDYETGKVVLEAIARVNAEMGTTTIIITHNAAIAGMADRVLRLGGGRVVSINRNEKRLSPQEMAW